MDKAEIQEIMLEYVHDFPSFEEFSERVAEEILTRLDYDMLAQQLIEEWVR